MYCPDAEKAASVVSTVAGIRYESPGFENLLNILGFSTKRDSGANVSGANSTDYGASDATGDKSAVERPRTRLTSDSGGAPSTCANEINSDDQSFNKTMTLVAVSLDACSPANSTNGDEAWQLQVRCDGDDYSCCKELTELTYNRYY